VFEKFDRERVTLLIRAVVQELPQLVLEQHLSRRRIGREHGRAPHGFLEAAQLRSHGASLFSAGHLLLSQGAILGL
jgi:hypothetical protein